MTEAAQAVVEGSLLALYKYDAPRTKKDEADETSQIDSLSLVEFDQTKIGQIEAGGLAGQAIAESVYLVRTLVNRPSNVATPRAIAEAAQAMADRLGLTCRVLNEDEMREESMGALLAVTRGAS